MLLSKKILFCTLLLSLSFAQTAENVPLTLHDPLCRVMQATGAQLSRAYITGSAEIALPDDADAAAAALTARVGRALGGAGETVELRRSDYQTLARLSFNGAARQTIVFVKHRAAAPPGAKNAALTVRVIKENPTEEDIASIKKEISSVLQKNRREARISTCLEGYLDGKLRKDEWAYCLRDAFDAAGAKTLTKTATDRYASYAGYSPLLAEPTDGVNLNVALRYHAFDRRTYVMVASPLITVEY